MKAALIVMTIMGCDDSVTQCHYIDTTDRSWQTVSLCDADAESYINRHQNSPYPVIVAVCESMEDRDAGPLAEGEADTADTPGTAVAQAPAPPDTKAKQGLAARTLDFVKGALPDAADVRAVFVKPVHTIEDGYAWVVRRLTD